ncbi:hypothetical protein HDE_12587 [Halotydeus destructor]|nr:hypothetical protein HDE_12587 [Halotydeus destructor]
MFSLAVIQFATETLFEQSQRLASRVFGLKSETVGTNMANGNEASNIADTQHQTVTVVNDFFSNQLLMKGHQWTPSSDQVDGPVMALDKIMNSDLRRRLRETLTTKYGAIMEEVGDALLTTVENCMQISDLPRPDMSYRDFESLGHEMFRDGCNWNKILTLMTFSVELAFKAGVSHSKPEMVDLVSGWCNRFLTSPEVAAWIHKKGWSRLLYV